MRKRQQRQPVSNCSLVDCAQCGTPLDAIQLITPKCTICNSVRALFARCSLIRYAWQQGQPLAKKKEAHLFLDLKKIQPQTEKWVNQSSGQF